MSRLVCRDLDLLPLSPTTLKRLGSSQIKFDTVYIPHAQEPNRAFEVTRWTRHDSIKLVMLKKTRDDLRAKGYTVNLYSPDSTNPTTHWLTLSHATHNITIEFQHALRVEGEQELTIASSLKVSGEGWGGTSQIMTSDSLPWSPKLFGSGSTGKLLIWEELTLAAKDHYVIHIEL